MSFAAITVANLNKLYRVWPNPSDMLLEALFGGRRHRDFQALTDISFEVMAGSVVAIIGRNGAGKSTLLRIIAKTLDATSGDVSVVGRVSAILELGSGFHGEYSGRENIYLGGLCLGLTRQEITKKFDEIVAFAELEDFIEQPFRTYSTGMQARLTFSVATCVDPDVLIIDEALSVGDARFQLKCYDRIRSFKDRGKSILLVSHSISSIVSICDRAILLEKGRLIANGDPNDVSNLYHELLFSPNAPNISGPAAVSIASNAIAKAPVASEKQSGELVVAGEAMARDDQEETAAGQEISLASHPESDRLVAAALDTSVNMRERRYGLRRAEIASIRLVDLNGKLVRTVESLKEYIVVCRILAQDPADDLGIGFHVRDSRGVELYGWDMQGSGMFPPLKPFQAGEGRDVAIRFRVNMAAGHYFIGITLAHWDRTKEDVRFDAHDLIVDATPTIHTSSLVNLEVELDENYSVTSKAPLVIRLGPFIRDQGHSWTFELSAANIPTDSAGYSSTSTVSILEDGNKIGPAHSTHEEVRRKGKGAYSHWEGVLYMSTSDNSDPNSNNRTYHAVVPQS